MAFTAGGAGGKMANTEKAYVFRRGAGGGGGEVHSGKRLCPVWGMPSRRYPLNLQAEMPNRKLWERS